MFQWLMKKPPEEPPKLEMQGQPIHMNLTPLDMNVIKRHLARIIRCMDNIKREDLKKIPNQVKVAELKREINRRRKLMDAVERPVPHAYDDIVQMLNDMGGV